MKKIMTTAQLINQVKNNVGYSTFKSKGGMFYELKENDNLLNGFSFYRVHSNLYVCDFMMPTFVKHEFVSLNFGKLLSHELNKTHDLFRIDNEHQFEITANFIIDILNRIEGEKMGQDLNTLYSHLSNVDRYRKGIHFFNAFISLNLLLKTNEQIEESFNEFFHYWETSKPDREWEHQIHDDLINLYDDYKNGTHKKKLESTKIDTLKNLKLLDY